MSTSQAVSTSLSDTTKALKAQLETTSETIINNDTEFINTHNVTVMDIKKKTDNLKSTVTSWKVMTVVSLILQILIAGSLLYIATNK